MPATAATVVCEYHGEHGRIDERLEQLEDRADKHDDKLEEVQKVGQGIREELAGMRGEIRGALAASKVSGAVIGSLLTAGASGAVALLVYLLNHSPK